MKRFIKGFTALFLALCLSVTGLSFTGADAADRSVFAAETVSENKQDNSADTEKGTDVSTNDGQNSDSDKTAEDTDPEDIEEEEEIVPVLSQKKMTLELGKKVKLTVTGNVGKVKWSSKNPEVAKVLKNGKVIGKSEGKTYIYAKVDGQTLRCKVTVKEAKYVSIIAVGDNLYHDYMIYKKGNSANGMVDYDNIYSGIKDYIASADVKIINQETILTSDKSKWKGYPQFGTPLAVGDAVVRAGFNVITTATNHAVDNGTSGVLGAVRYWKSQAENGVLMTGTYDSQADYDKICVGEYNGVKIAFLNYTYGTNGIPLESGKPYLVKLLKESLIEKEIKAAKKLADVVIVLPHWGEEYHFRPVSSQKNLAKKMADWGADIIIGAHPHVLEPMVTITASDGRKVPCYYSLGNFCGNMAITHNTNCTLEGMAEITIKVYDGKVTIESAELTPLVNHINNTDTQFKVYRLVDYTDAIAKGHLANNRSAGTITVDKLWKLYQGICEGTAKSPYD